MKERRKTVVVFGATGHLGCYSALALRRAGYRVIAVGRRESDGGFFSRYGIDFVGGVVLETSDWADKLSCYPEIDAVVDLAGTMPAHSGLSPMPYVQGIVAAIVNVAEWMNGRGIRRIVFNTTPSDVAELFGSENPIDDDAPRSFPKNGNDHAVYAICKNAAVDILEYYKIKFGFSPCIFRHFMVYGWHPNAYYHLDGKPHLLPYRLMIRRAIAGERLSVWGDPKVCREMLYIEDFADAVVAAVGSDAVGIYNLSSDRRYSLEEQVVTLAKVFSLDYRGVDYSPDKPTAPRLQLSGMKAARDLGWRAKWTWLRACEDMRRYYIHNDFAALWGAADPEDRLLENAK